MIIFYCVRLETPRTWRTRSLYLYPPGTGWPGYNPRDGVPFSSPPTTRRATVEVFDPACTRAPEQYYPAGGCYAMFPVRYEVTNILLSADEISASKDVSSWQRPAANYGSVLLRASHIKANPSSRRRGRPISKRLSGLGTSKNNVMSPDGGRNQK
jgi:hypothetical protein